MASQFKQAHKEGAAQDRARESSRSTLFEQLRQEHDSVRGLFEKMAKSGKKEVESRQQLFRQIEQELVVHMEGEERFLYTALEQHDESRERVLAGYEEHVVARTVIGAFTSLAVDDERWAPKLKVLRDLLLRHMAEEEGELFPRAEELLAREQLEGIADKMQQLKREAQQNRPVTRRAGGDTES